MGDDGGLGPPLETRRLTRSRVRLTLAFAQIFHLGNARSEGPVLSRRDILGNLPALGAVVLATGLQLLVALWSPFARALHVSPMSASAWLVVMALGSMPAVVGQTVKWPRASRSW